MNDFTCDLQDGQDQYNAHDAVDCLAAAGVCIRCQNETDQEICRLCQDDMNAYLDSMPSWVPADVDEEEKFLASLNLPF